MLAGVMVNPEPARKCFAIQAILPTIICLRLASSLPKGNMFNMVLF
jgi:hypothetical protein